MVLDHRRPYHRDRLQRVAIGLPWAWLSGAVELWSEGSVARPMVCNLHESPIQTYTWFSGLVFGFLSDEDSWPMSSLEGVPKVISHSDVVVHSPKKSYNPSWSVASSISVLACAELQTTCHVLRRLKAHMLPLSLYLVGFTIMPTRSRLRGVQLRVSASMLRGCPPTPHLSDGRSAWSCSGSACVSCTQKSSTIQPFSNVNDNSND